MTSWPISNPCRSVNVRDEACKRVLSVLGLGAVFVCAGVPSSRGFDFDIQSNPTVLSEWNVLTQENGLPHDSVRTISLLDGEVWVGTDGGIGVWVDDHWSSRDATIGWQEFPASSIQLDPATRDVWIGTLGGGLIRLTGGRCDHFHQRNAGLAGDVVFSVSVLGGRIWVATNGGLSAYNPMNDVWDSHFLRRRGEDQPFAPWVVNDGFDIYAVFREGLPARWDATGQQWRSILTDSMDQLGGTNLGVPTLALCHAASVATREGRLCWTVHERPDVMCTGSTTNEAGLDVSSIRLTHANRYGDSLRSLATSGIGEWAADDETLVQILSQNSWLEYGPELRSGGISVRQMKRGQVVGTCTVPGAWSRGRIRCVAANEREVWIGTTQGLVHGTRPIPWPEVSGSPSGGSDDSSRRIPDPRETGVKTRSEGASFNPSAIAIYGPRNRTIALPANGFLSSDIEFRPDQSAVTSVLESMNSTRVRRNLPPIELVSAGTGYAAYGWGLPEDDLARFAVDHRVVGVLGDAGKAGGFTDTAIASMEVAWVDVSPTPLQTMSHPLRNPWVFQCHGDLPRQHRLLLDYIKRTLGRSRFAVIRDPGGIGDLYVTWWLDYATAGGTPMLADVRWPYQPESVASALAELRNANPDVVLTWSDAQRSAEIFETVRGAGITALFVGGPELMSVGFASAVCLEGESILALLPTEQPTDLAAAAAFNVPYDKRYIRESGGRGSSFRFSRSLCAADHLVRALEIPGNNRDKVRSALEAMERSSRGEMHIETRFPGARATIAMLEGDRWCVKEIGGP